MIDQIHRIRDEAKGRILSAPDTEELDRLRVHYLGKKGLITNMLKQLKEMTPEEKREAASVLNAFKTDFENALDSKQSQLEQSQLAESIRTAAALDVTLPGVRIAARGSLHPLTHVRKDLIRALSSVGFSFLGGPEAELEYYNFEALNTPESHPARDMQDTLYIAPPVLLRSHTSPVQIRAMKRLRPPLQIMTIGRVYRSDYDQTHTPMFHQIEGLMVDERIAFSDLKGIVEYLVGEIFGQRPIRFRPSFFPFTEPSAEIDMWMEGRGWLEIGGCGMVHPKIFSAVGYDPDGISGFAFGFGLERIAMLRYGIEDLRSFFENDYRMLEQF
jgi:phenylalanyl-tRNA synthetase alpha chain